MTTVNQVGSREVDRGRRALLAGRYRALETLAAGPESEVFLAEDSARRDRCVVKLLSPRASAQRLRGEFARLTELDHPNIVRVRDGGVLGNGPAAGRAYLVTDYLAGSPLAESLPGSPVEARVDAFSRAAEALFDALAYLHGRGILHGDISPANVRCDESGKPFLIDFGLGAWIGPASASEGQGASGTLGFLAPEALLGERGPAGDLFAMGATLYDTWTGVPPFGVGLDAVRRAWDGPPPAPSTLHPGLPPAWDRLLLTMLASTVEDRPLSARAVLQEIHRLLPGRPVEVEDDLSPPFPGGDPFAGVLVGRGDEQAQLRHYLDQLALGAATVCLVCVTGPTGSGRHALLTRLIRDARLALLSRVLEGIDLEEATASDLLAGAASATATAAPEDLGEGAGDARARLAAVVAHLEERSAGRPLCLLLAGSAEDEMLARALVGSPPSGRLLVLLPCERAPDGDGSGMVNLRLGPLSRTSISELARRSVGSEPPAEVLDQIMAGSSGLAGLAVLLLRRWLERARTGRPGLTELGADEPDLDRLLDASFRSLSPAARASVVRGALATVWPSSEPQQLADGAASPNVDSDLEIRFAGWEVNPGRGWPSDAHLAAVWRAVAVDRALAQVARDAASRLPAADPRLGEVQYALGEREMAAATFGRAMQAAELQMAWSRVAYLGLRALDAAGGLLTWAQRLALANALGILGRYSEGLRILDEAPLPAEAATAATVAERKAWLLGRRGETEAARRLLESSLRSLPAAGEVTDLLRARLARLLVSSGGYAEALATAEPLLSGVSAAALAARESAVLAAAYAGQLTSAARILAPLRQEADRKDDCGLAARVAALEGLVAQLAGRPLVAQERYRKAVDGYRQMHDLHGSAAAGFNLGCALAETGDNGEAMAALDRAIRELGHLGAAADHALAVFNVGQLFLQIGDLESAIRAMSRLESEARKPQVQSFAAYADWLAAEVERHRRRWPACSQRYRAAVRAFSQTGRARLAALASLGEAEALAEQGQIEDARQGIAAVRAAGAAGAGADRSLADSLALAAARVTLADGKVDASDLRASAEAMAEMAKGARSLGRLPLAWRAASLAARLYDRAGDGRRDEQLSVARRCFEEVKMKTPASHWPGLHADRDARAWPQSQAEGTTATTLAERSALLEGRLRRLLRINKRLNSELRLSRVLETIIDTVIELTDAERGFLLLKDAGGELVVKVARNIDQTTLEGPSLSLSRSIAKQAADTATPVITVDAAGDSRFAEHLSVSDLHLRSVLAVPLAVKGTVAGTIYVDHRLRKGVFGDDELAMVLDFAEQGAIAIENARVIAELRRREQQVQSLNRRLERELRVQEAALSEARIELKESRQVAALRYDYQHIVGQSSAMLDLFRLLDRVTDTNLPVVIEGESGTGKELVARAIHFHGARKSQAFVSENCAAIPETLLESALFGHVRGAFTGADREARGLFAIANGGTLFLDEVADMSPAMQGKLLRVLQDGEFHRVGAERPEKADVRVLVASNQNLARLVEDGKFRKDLYYRLSVVKLYLPPLRERREDIPLLVRHFLDKAAEASRGSAKQVDGAALARLCAYAWPGNVRELENEIARAGVFAGETIGVADLSPHVQSGQDPNEVVRNEPDSLRLRQRVERLERQIIREALGRSHGNQTKAALLLGLSRFGLQKKLRRYGLAA